MQASPLERVRWISLSNDGFIRFEWECSVVVIPRGHLKPTTLQPRTPENRWSGKNETLKRFPNNIVIQFSTLLLRWVEMSSREWRSHIIVVVVLDVGCHIFSPSEKDIECTENFPFFLLLELQVWVDIFYVKGRLKSFKNSSSSAAAIVEFILLLNKRVVQPSHHLWCVPSIFPALCWCCYSSLTYWSLSERKRSNYVDYDFFSSTVVVKARVYLFS